MIIDAFRKGVLKPTDDIDEGDKEDEKDLCQNSEESVGERVKLRRQESDKLNEIITKKDKIIGKDLFIRHFQFQNLSDMQKMLSKAQSTKKKKG